MNIKTIMMLGYMYGFLWLRRNMLSMIWLFSTPFTILFLFYVVAGEGALITALIGSYIMLFVNAGVGVIGDAVWNKHELKFQDILVASPVTVFDYIAGIALAEIFFTLPGIVVLLIPLILYQGSFYWLFTLVAVPTITWLIVSAISFYFSTYVPNARNGWQVGVLLNLLLTILPPVFYPIEKIPDAIRPIAYLVPTTHSALLLKNSAGIIQLGTIDILFSWSYLLIALVTLTLLTINKAQWREN
ncbi:MAG: ABC transporter permease [Nitrososphaeria archaeon]